MFSLEFFEQAFSAPLFPVKLFLHPCFYDAVDAGPAKAALHLIAACCAIYRIHGLHLSQYVCLMKKINYLMYF
jgi:hypothetical protein